jgi:hypothetical protein
MKYFGNFVGCVKKLIGWQKKFSYTNQLHGPYKFFWTISTKRPILSSMFSDFSHTELLLKPHNWTIPHFLAEFNFFGIHFLSKKKNFKFCLYTNYKFPIITLVKKKVYYYKLAKSHTSFDKNKNA